MRMEAFNLSNQLKFSGSMLVKVTITPRFVKSSHAAPGGIEVTIVKRSSTDRRAAMMPSATMRNSPGLVTL